MALAQKDIIEVIPRIIFDSDFSLLLSLKTLARRGWGADSTLCKMLDSLLDIHQTVIGEGVAIIFDDETLTYQVASRQENDGQVAFTNTKGETLLVLKKFDPLTRLKKKQSD